MKRRAFRIVVLLILLGGGGAILNVAVAWGAAAWAPRRMIEGPGKYATDEIIAWWNGNAPPEFEVPFTNVRNVLHWSGFAIEGFVMLEYHAGGNSKFGNYYAMGWPWASLSAESWFSPTDGAFKVESGVAIGDYREDRYLPLRPLWPGFAINTIFYAAILGVLWFGPGAVRRMIRRRRGLCPACAYPIGTGPVCTECGQAVRGR